MAGEGSTAPNATPAGSGAKASNTPVPDPTVLTTEALRREVQGLQDLIEQRLEGVMAVQRERDRRFERELELIAHEREGNFEKLKEDIIERVEARNSLDDEKFKGIHDRFEIARTERGAVVDSVDEKVSFLADLTSERFKSIGTQFQERDTRSERESRDNKVAVDAAFAAQKEAAAKQEETFSKGIDKSELATSETISKLAELFKTTTDAINDKIDDLKQRIADVDKRVNGTEQQRMGAVDERSGYRDSRTGIRQQTGLYIAAAAVFVSLGGIIVALLARTG